MLAIAKAHEVNSQKGMHPLAVRFGKPPFKEFHYNARDNDLAPQCSCSGERG